MSIEDYSRILTAANRQIPDNPNYTITGSINYDLLNSYRNYVKIHGYPSAEKYDLQLKKAKIRR